MARIVPINADTYVNIECISSIEMNPRNLEIKVTMNNGNSFKSTMAKDILINMIKKEAGKPMATTSSAESRV